MTNTLPTQDTDRDLVLTRVLNAPRDKVFQCWTQPDLIKQWFGTYEQWEMEFKKTANALGGGSGWTILSYNLHTSEVHNYWAWDHMHNPPMGYPLLVLDMYEHAYHMDYGAAAAKYVDAFMQNVNCDEVNRRVEEIRVRK